MIGRRAELSHFAGKSRLPPRRDARECERFIRERIPGSTRETDGGFRYAYLENRADDRPTTGSFYRQSFHLFLNRLNPLQKRVTGAMLD